MNKALEAADLAILEYWLIPTDERVARNIIANIRRATASEAYLRATLRELEPKE